MTEQLKVTYQDIPTKDIDFTRNDLKLRTEPDTRKELIEFNASIKENGLIQPIIVRPIRDSPSPTGANRYEIIDGNRRLRASKHLKHKEISACIIENPDDSIVRAIAFNLNTCRLSLDEKHQIKFALKLCEELGIRVVKP